MFRGEARVPPIGIQPVCARGTLVIQVAKFALSAGASCVPKNSAMDTLDTGFSVKVKDQAPTPSSHEDRWQQPPASEHAAE